MPLFKELLGSIHQEKYCSMLEDFLNKSEGTKVHKQLGPSSHILNIKPRYIQYNTISLWLMMITGILDCECY